MSFKTTLKILAEAGLRIESHHHVLSGYAKGLRDRKGDEILVFFGSGAHFVFPDQEVEVGEDGWAYVRVDPITRVMLRFTKYQPVKQRDLV